MACRTATTTDAALAAFVATKGEIDRMLAALAALSADHFGAGPDEVTWGHVGTATHVRDRLQEIASFATGEG